MILSVETYFIALIVACGILAIAAAVLIVRHWGSWDESSRQGVITQLYALGKIVLNALKNDGKISGDELSDILTQIQAIIASARKTTIDKISDEFKSNSKEEKAINVTVSE